MSTNPPAAWHPDPQDPTQLRYWDGAQWTEHLAPNPAAAAPAEPQPTPPSQSSDQLPTDEADDRWSRRGSGLLGRTTKKDIESEAEELRQSLKAAGGLGLHEVRLLETELRAEVEGLQAKKQHLEANIVDTDEIHMLQMAGVYHYRHPAEDSTHLKAQIDSLQLERKQLIKSKTAVTSAANWTLNGSETEGKKMIRDLSTLMLQAYNSQLESELKNMKGARLEPALKRIDKAEERIRKLAAFAGIAVSTRYHSISQNLLSITADYQVMVAEEKERAKEERARIREEEKVRKEIAKEKERLEKERRHYEQLVNSLRTGTTDTSPEELVEAETKLAELGIAMESVEHREANTRAGYVYVISNLGAMGEGMVKIGMTRRLDPMDRVKELGDASVPFKFDVHCITFSEDAVGLETHLHQVFADRRVNKVNLRREFFYVTPDEVRQHLQISDGSVLHYEELQPADEYRQSWPPTSVAGTDSPAAGSPLQPSAPTQPGT